MFYGQYVTFSLCCSFRLTFFSCSSVGSLFWSAVLQGKNCGPVPSGSIHLLQCGLFHELQGISVPSWVLHELQGISAVMLWSTNSSSDPGVPSAVFQPPPCTATPRLPVQCFLPFLKCFHRRATNKLGSILTYSGFVLEPAGKDCVRHRTAPGLFPQRPPL